MSKPTELRDQKETYRTALKVFSYDIKPFLPLTASGYTSLRFKMYYVVILVITAPKNIQ